MSIIRFKKIVANLPAQLEPNTIYTVRTGAGFDLYISDATGSVAYKLNEPNINNYMLRSIYVDPVNGNNNNTGTEQSPVRTIKYAVENLVPSGAYANIILMSGEHKLTQDIALWNKVIILLMRDGATLTTEWKIVNINNTSYATINRFLLHNSVLRIQPISGGTSNLIIPPKNLSEPTFPYSGLILVPDLWTGTAIIRPGDSSNFNIEINNTTLIRNVSGVMNVIFHLNFLQGYNLSFNLVDNDAFIFVNHGTGTVNIRFWGNREIIKNGNVIFKPTTPEIYNLKEAFGGIKVDTITGLPRNAVIDDLNYFGFM